MMKGVIFLVLFLSAFKLAAAEFVVLSDPWCPYACEQGSDQPGLIIELAQLALKGSGHTLVYKNQGWDSALADVRDGKSDSVAGAYKSDAPGFVFPEQAMAVSRNCFFVKSGSEWRFAGRKSLEQLASLGVVEGYSYGKRFDEFIAKNPAKIVAVEGEDPLADNLANLDAGKVAAILEEEQVTVYTLNKQGIMGRYSKVGCAKPTKMYIAFSPAKPELKAIAEALGDGMARIKASKEVEAVYSRYGLNYNK